MVDKADQPPKAKVPAYMENKRLSALITVPSHILSKFDVPPG
jgi:hypothetical protein